MSMKADQILTAAAGHLSDRAATYDQPGGERSMSKAVSMFNTLAGSELTVEQGWLFMAILKMVRTQQGGYRADSYEDGASYFALAGEEASAPNINQAELWAKASTPDKFYQPGMTE